MPLFDVSAGVVTDGIDIGAVVWSRVRIGAEERHPGGMVVDVGVNTDGTGYVVVLDEHVTEPVKAWKLRNRVVARRILLADIDEPLTKPADKIRMVGGARGALLTVGCGSRMFSMVERELAYYGALLLETSVS